MMVYNNSSIGEVSETEQLRTYQVSFTRTVSYQVEVEVTDEDDAVSAALEVYEDSDETCAEITVEAVDPVAK